MANLPQELIDRVIDELAQAGFANTLPACCLVQKRWVERSRRHIFENISLYSVDDFRDWVRSVSLGLDSPCRHVRSLTYRQGAAVLGPKQLLDLYPGHFTSFTRLETLQIFNLSLPRFTATSMKKAFEPVGHFVRTLIVKDVVLTLSGLLMFLVHFPRLETLQLGDNLTLVPERKKRPPNLPCLTGELALMSMGAVHRPFILELSRLPLRYSSLDVEFRWNSETLNAIAHLILTCSPTLEDLTLRYARALFVEDAEEPFPLDLKSCSHLRKVRLQAPKREAEEHLVRLLGTIRSHKLETIEFMGSSNTVQPSSWAMIEDELCSLVDKLEGDGWKGHLRVMVCYSAFREDAPEKGKLLARFRERGEVVESVDDGIETLWESYWC